MSRRMNRVEQAFKQEIAEIIEREIKDPRIGFVTVTGVEISSDLRHGKVYVSIFGNEEEIENTIEGLRSATGFVKRHLGERLRLRFMPELEFIHENISERAVDLTGKIRTVINEDELFHEK
ncbi:MAG: 30S ribosome-binding factor RbfA [Actinomycetota bacterium]|nr:30S ribosome-binding factor RbfA [Actinomycetota bacterium]